jgi:very-short-patch-repair endonuclease
MGSAIRRKSVAPAGGGARKATRPGVRKHLDAAIAELAARQHGVVARRQLLAVGAGEHAIRYRVAERRLHAIHPGVYAVGHSLLAPRAHCLAAVLACGESAVLSHRSAAALWGLRPPPAGLIDVTIPSKGGRRRASVALHVTRSLDSGDVTRCDGIPCTTPARTLVDLACVATSRTLERALEQSLVLRLFDRRALEVALAGASGRRGAGTLRRLLADLPDDPPAVRSELERRFLDLVRGARLPMPVINGRLAGYEVDFHWPEERLVVETDGRATHDTAHAFERDHRRDLDLELAGWHVLRLTWRQLVAEPSRVTAMLRARVTPRTLRVAV